MTSGLGMAMVVLGLPEVSGEKWCYYCIALAIGLKQRLRLLAGLVVVCFSVVFARRTEAIQPAGRRERVPFCSHAPACIGIK